MAGLHINEDVIFQFHEVSVFSKKDIKYICMCVYVYVCVCVFRRQRAREGARMDKECLDPVFPNDCNKQDWARSKSGDMNFVQVSLEGDTSAYFPGKLSETQQQSRQDSNQMSDMGY